jgi:hypothetical protein
MKSCTRALDAAPAKVIEVLDERQLYNLRVDPSELSDLSALSAYQPKLAEIQSLLADERAAHDDPLTK